MPKSSKKRKDKAADFAKAKLKLGKGKQAPSNVIDTSFKARSIALPNQSITIEHDGETPTTKRRQTLDDLISHLKHHNPGARKDALFGLRELLSAHSQLVNSSFPVLANTTVRLIADEDSGVRSALITFYSWLLPRILPEDVIPHASILLLYTSSAQTHIFPEIRIDAVRFLNLLLECIPETVVSGWDTRTNSHGSRILTGYLGILNAGTIYNNVNTPTATSAATVMLTAQSKLVVLQSLSRFLNVALGSRSGEVVLNESVDGWFMVSSFSDKRAYIAFDSLLKVNHSSDYRHWRQRADLDTDKPVGVFSSTMKTDSWGLEQIVKLNDRSEGSDDLVAVLVSKLATALHPTLTSIFIECSAAVFSPSNAPPETELQFVLAVTAIACALYNWLLQARQICPTSIDELASLLNCVTPFFPFTFSGHRDVKVEHAFRQLNLEYCDLISRLVFATQSKSSSQQRHPEQSQSSVDRSSKQTTRLLDQISHVREYVLGELGHREKVSSRPLTLTAYTSLLPTVWALINARNSDPGLNGPPPYSDDVFLALVEHGIRISTKSALKKCSTEFIAKLVLLETDAHYRGGFRLPQSADSDRIIGEWVTHLPKVLWELGSNNLSTTEAILLFLTRTLQRRVHNSRTLSSLQTRLVPYFLITHPERGRIQGPYSKLPAFTSSETCTRRLVLNMCATLLLHSHSETHLLEAIQSVIKLNPAEAVHWHQVSVHA
ncbi:hypothetical protein E1B28_001151 [Marasmius oreades]|uniref:Pre-rRNA-processing protein n=1 Tax=Marasmius oreades TaxID=181124 RepID=A0A9P7V360_9AGAR|nr:uncharacterized protein E1B28_001151 [Marasmius oreades]KAG7099292.1 hypothetical protein E1B28_001151 [Marasmius oreades]